MRIFRSFKLPIDWIKYREAKVTALTETEKDLICVSRSCSIHSNSTYRASEDNELLGVRLMCILKHTHLSCIDEKHLTGDCTSPMVNFSFDNRIDQNFEYSNWRYIANCALHKSILMLTVPRRINLKTKTFVYQNQRAEQKKNRMNHRVHNILIDMSVWIELFNNWAWVKI